MADKVLLVDDDSNVLASFQRHLRRKFFIDTALSGKEGLKLVSKDGPYSVVVSDLRMPGMDGIEFLSRVREITPDTVRIMLTGNADVKAAIQAVNEGNVFRFLTKPCPLNILVKALTMGIEQYQLITAERELLEKTLRGNIRVLTQVLELVNPEAFGRSSRIKRYVRDIALSMKASDVWRLETAAMLSQIGCIILPEQAVKKLYNGEQFTNKEAQIFDTHPSIASEMLNHVPRMKTIAEIVAYQEKHFDGSGVPRDSLKGEEIPLGARILKVALDLDTLLAAGHTQGEALSKLEKRSGCYDPVILDALEVVIGTNARHETRSVTVSELNENMILEEDIRTSKGQLLISKGQEVSQPLIARLRNFAGTVGIKQPIQVIERIT